MSDYILNRLERDLQKEKQYSSLLEDRVKDLKLEITSMKKQKKKNEALIRKLFKYKKIHESVSQWVSIENQIRPHNLLISRLKFFIHELEKNFFNK